MLVATLEIARDSIDHDAPDFWGREAVTRLIDSAVADDCRRVPPREFQVTVVWLPISIKAVSDVTAADDGQRRTE
jgi:hypothetical protein